MPAPPIRPGPIREALDAGHGLIRATECDQLGMSRGRLYRLVERGALVGVAKGVYADGAQLRAADPWGRFRLRTRAFLLAGPPDAHAAGWSSVVLQGLPTLGPPPAVPSVLRPGSTGSGSNTTVWGRTRFATVPDRWLGAVDGAAALHPAFAAVDLARLATSAAGLVLADAVARRPGGREELAGALRDILTWSGAGRAGRIIRLSDPDAESPLESLGRLAFLNGRLPAGRSNCWVGEFVPEFRLDHYWPEFRVGAEADGIGKYLTDPATAIRKEKAREWRFQELGIRLLRYGWSIAFHQPAVLADRLRALLAAPIPPAPVPVRVWARADGAALLGLPLSAPDRSGR